jgi:hypothetical protein
MKHLINLPCGSGNYGSDCAEGYRHARRVADFMRITANPILLAAIVRTLPRDMDGVAIGFLTAMGAMIVESVDTDL